MIKGLALSKVTSHDDRVALLSESDAIDYKSLGITRVRIEMALGESRDWLPEVLGLYRAILDWYHKQGIGVHLLIPYQTLIIAMPGGWGVPVSDAAWTDYCTAYAAACGAIAGALPDAAIFELINEPNLLGHPNYITPAQYAQLHAAALPAIRAHSKAPVATGGLFGHAMHQYGGQTPDNCGATYARAMLVALKDTYHVVPDQVCYHFYGGPGGALDRALLATYLGWMETAIIEACGVNLPMCLSEVGWQSTIVGETTQAANITALYAECRLHQWVDSVLYFSHYDSAQSNPPLFYGVRVSELSRKEAPFKALAGA